ncbi:MAG: FKBP-type peptidyl-prolyl cis-trans isomerase, partial [Candidatus Thermoplasmatota archaeon]|nr:FKBP-type peptidyl-prolyl cis-trans isomerase [Candidatus Thermoplasmatota archaeon]
ETMNNDTVDTGNIRISKNDFIYLDYDQWVVTDGKEELVDTTIKENAKNTEVNKEQYAPIGVIVGSGFIIKSLEEQLEKMTLNKEEVIIIPPEKGYGERDLKKVRLYSSAEVLRVMKKYKIDKPLTVGLEMPMVTGKNDDGEPVIEIGRVMTVTPGRVRIDFNNKYSGKTMKFKMKIIKRIDNNIDKMRFIIEHYYSNPDDFVIDFKDDNLIMKIPERAWQDHDWFDAKVKIISSYREFVDKEGRITIIEEHYGIAPLPEKVAESLKNNDAGSKAEAGKENESVTEPQPPTGT